MADLMSRSQLRGMKKENGSRNTATLERYSEASEMLQAHLAATPPSPSQPTLERTLYKTIRNSQKLPLISLL